jgi:hypothetical protein
MQNINVDRKLIKLDDPLKAVGRYEVVVRFSADASVDIRVNVVGVGALEVGGGLGAGDLVELARAAGEGGACEGDGEELAAHGPTVRDRHGLRAVPRT